MTLEVAHQDQTRERLLAAAERLFAEHGFSDVTVRDICREAGANVAAVNYHFRDKLGLYRETIRVAVRSMQEATEAARQAGIGQRPEEQLRRYISLFLQRLLAPGQKTIHRLIDREMNEPTPALDDLVRDGMKPRLEYLSGIVGAMLGCDPSDRRVLLCVLSVQSQSLMYARSSPVAARLGFSTKPASREIEEVARHIAEFSVAGIRAVRHCAKLSRVQETAHPKEDPCRKDRHTP